MSNPYESQQQLSPADEKMWATLIHIGGIFFSFVPALIGYLVLKDRGPFVREHSRNALNFQLTMLLASFIGGITSVILIGFLILGAVFIVVVVFSILAAVAANRGQMYVYPLTIQFVK
ncbi:MULTISPECIES: DUF4870 domain-containing protein [unclassified Salinibacterium]|uniref:DUF4870 domain-containing protein n=1 Tax=unclassified Salinibacterium TaxID=2632331 RepID=UPI001422E44F|nr:MULTISPECIES: DUF4870 domain-containing protein [unclassified Salinibacterium]